MNEIDQSDLMYDIAIVGMSGRFPGARSVDEFWRNVRDGVESISFFTVEEMAEAGTPLSLLKNPSYVRANGTLQDIELFDAAFFGFSPREAEVMDPQQRLFLECAWEALEVAGYDPDTYKKSIGVYAGTTRSSYVNNIYSNLELAESVGMMQIGISNDKDHLAPRISYKLNLKGASVTVQTACSTSLVAVSLACQNLLNFSCDMALAGGVSISAVQKTGYIYMEGGINSPDGHCRAFDAQARGCIGGNGVGVVLLKRLTDALAEGDSIFAVIKGSATNNDGSLKVGYTAPSVEGQSAVITEAMAMAGVNPETISYVEAHGTGTTLGDPIEIAALTKAYRKQTAKKNFCAVGSAKTNVGHLDAAAGVTGLIKAVLALRNKQLPPSINFTEPNPKIDFAGSPFFINTTLRSWERNGTPRRAAVSSFGIGGTNAHVVLEEAPSVKADQTQRPFQLLPLSARSETALEDATQNLLEHLRNHPEESLADVAYTLQAGRRTFTYRRAFVCGDNEDAVRVLETHDPQRTVMQTAEPVPERPVVFMFPGQGTQYVGMGEELYRHEPLFRETVDRCCEVLRAHLKLDLREVLYPTAENRSAAEAQLRETSLTQPALFVIEYALAQLWMSWGVRPRAMIGHSIGEYVAACVAGVITLNDALSLVAKRGAMMQGLASGAMLAVPLCEEDVTPMLGAGLSLAAVNNPKMLVLSGEFDAIAKLQSRLSERDIECQLLRTSHAFHSRMMQPIVDSFAAEVAKVTLKAPSIPFVSNVTGTWIKANEAVSPVYWAKQLRQAVRFSDGLEELLQEQQSVFLEVGPGRTLENFAKMHPSKTGQHVVVSSMRRAVDNESDIASILKAAGRLWQAGMQLDWAGLHKGEQRRRLPLPTYPFERQRYWAERRKQQAPANPAASLQKKSDIADWFYAPSWKQTPAYRAKTQSVRETWLVFVDESGVGPSLTQRLSHEGNEVISVRAGEDFGANAGGYTINPSRAEDYVALIEDLQRAGTVPSSIAHLWNMERTVGAALRGRPMWNSSDSKRDNLGFREHDFHAGRPQSAAPTVRPAAPDSFEHAQAFGFFSIIYLTQALEKQGLTDPLRIVLVTSGVQSVTGEEQLHPEKATLLGLRNVIPQEYPNITCANVDIVLPQPGTARETQLVEQLVVELTAKLPDEVVAYRGSRRWVQSFEPVRLTTGESGLEGLRDRGTYLITGGLGGVGLVLAEHLARTVHARLVLIGRKTLPDRSEWDTWLASHDAHNSVSRKIAAVKRLEELGSEVLIVSADVADEAQMRSALQQTQQRFGELHGVIHGAGISGPQSYRSISETGVSEAGWHFQPKVHGLYVLEKVLAGQSLDFCLLLSSLSSVLGGLGFAAYSSANVFMDAFAHAQRETTGVPWISVNWDGWQLGDEPETARKNLPIGAGAADLSINPAEGADVFSRILAVSPITQIIVSTGDLQPRLDKWIKRKTLATASTPVAKASNVTRYARPQLKNEFVAARNELEQTIADIWQDLLGIDQVGVNDNFFELGGHSLLATQLISRLRKTIQVEIPLRLIFETHTLAALAEGIAPLLDKDEALEIPSIVPVSREAALPLSFAQQRLWFLDQFEPDSTRYNMPIPLYLEGAIEHSVLERTLNELVRRHEVLRTTFMTVDGQPLQVIAPAKRSHLPLVDLSELPEDVRRAEANRLAIEEAQRPFSLSQGPLLRATLVRLAREEYFFLLTMHHIVSDGWSMAVFTKEIAQLYTAFARRENSPLPELPVQYADYAVWQRNWLSGDVLERHLDYWRKQLAGAPRLLELPTDRPRPAVQTHRGDSHSLFISSELTERLNTLSREHGATLFMTLLAAFQTLLMRYTGQEDISTGTPIAGRDRLETEPLIGFFINTLVLRTDLSGDPTFSELLDRVREVVLGAQQHQNLPFEKLVDDLQVERSLGHTPLFQVCFVLQNAGQESLELPGLKLNAVVAGLKTVKFDLTLEVVESARNTRCTLEYNSDLFDSATIERMLGHLHTLLDGITANTTARLSELPLLTDSEQRLLTGSNDKEFSYETPALCLHQLVEQQVERTPDAIALVYEQEQLSYRELNDRANQLAHHLRSLGAGPESLVGVLMERSTEMVVALLAIVKAGAAYVPLDPAYPHDRLTFMVADAGVKMIITQQHLAEKWASSSPELQILCLDRDWPQVAEHSRENPAHCSIATNAAYVIYTSGSTGQPKGVVVTRENVWRLLEVTRADFAFDSSDVWTLFHSVCFDFSVWELWGALAHGARLVVVPYWVSREPEAFYELLKENGVTVLNQTPSAFRQLMKVDEAVGGELPLRVVIFGGEALEMGTLRGWFERHGEERPRLVNMYGITETTVHVTYRELKASDVDGGSVIGGALRDLEIYVLDQHLRPVPEGVSGELYVGGAGVARGYLGRAELTAQRFVPHPYSSREGARLYRTGDVARWKANGELEYQGRIDDQVKIRGFRIELGEIANALLDQASVRECVVLALGEGGEEKRLVAYVVAQQSEAGLNTRELREELKQRLPDYMVPAAIVLLEAMPLTRNGKVDRRALPAPEEVRTESVENFVAPRTPFEEVLAGIWSDVLRTARIGVNDNFFELGGHSLLAMQIVSRIREAFGVEIPVRTTFEKQTLAMLAAEVEQLVYQGSSIQAPPIVPVPREGELPLSFAQQRMWFLNQLDPESHLYNMHSGRHLSGALNITALEQTFSEIIRRHEVLRTSFRIGANGRPAQIIEPAQPVKLAVVDLSGLSAAEQEAQVRELADREARKPFDLSHAPLLRVALIRLSEQEHVIFFTMHHIVGDAWSETLLRREIGHLYKAFSEGQPSPLAELAVQYADFAVWQKQWMESEVLEEQLNYWKQQLGDLPVLELPLDRPRPAIQSYAGSSHEVILSDSIAQAIKKLNREEGVTLFMTVLAAFQTLLHRYNGQDEIIVGTGIANRNRAETENLLGYFVNTLALRVDLSGNPTFRELLARVREVTLGAYAHQDLPFELLVEKLQPERMANRTPLFQVWCETETLGNVRNLTTDLTMSAMKYVRRVSYFDLMLFLTEAEGNISGYLNFNTDLFDADTIGEMTRRLIAVLESAAANPDMRLLDIPLGETETETLASADEDAFTFEATEPSTSFTFENESRALPFKKGDTTLTAEAIKNIAAIPRISRNENLPLSFAQQRLWFLHQLDPDSAVYNMSISVRLKGTLDIHTLERSLSEVVRRHEILRTSFTFVDYQPVQVVAPAQPLRLPLVDLTLVPSAERERKALELVTEEANRPFDLTTGPVLRVSLIRIDGKDHVVMLTMHHIVCDGWSMNVLMREIAAIYTALVNGEQSPLPELPVQYADFAHWQRSWLRDETLEAQLAYWREQMADAPPVLELPLDHPRPAVQTFRGATHSLVLSKSLSGKLRQLGKQENVTLFMLLLAAYKVLLYQYTLQEDIVVSTGVANRNRRDIQDQIGLHVNTLLLRTNFSGNPTFRELLRRVREVTLGAYDHQDLPFEMLVETLQPERSNGASPLFQTMFMLQNGSTAAEESTELPGLTMSGFGGVGTTSKFDLTLFANDFAESLKLTIEYNTDLFNSPTIVQMLKYFQTLLESIVENPDKEIDDISFMTTEESQQLIESWA